jgi:Fis family transcriptional regulator
MGTQIPPRAERDMQSLGRIIRQATEADRDLPRHDFPSSGGTDKVIFAKNINTRLDATVGELHGDGVFYAEAVREFKKRFIVTVLRDCGWNQCHAAKELHMHRNTLSRTIDELGINLREERKSIPRKNVRRAGIVPGEEHKVRS